MNLVHSPNTCSMTELAGIYADSLKEFKTVLAQCVKAARDASRKMIVANMLKDRHEQFGLTLKAAGFRFIGTYYGNSNCDVYTWVYGIEAPPEVVKPKLIRKIKRAVAR